MVLIFCAYVNLNGSKVLETEGPFWLSEIKNSDKIYRKILVVNGHEECDFGHFKPCCHIILISSASVVGQMSKNSKILM